MFVDFDDVFNEDPASQFKIPEHCVDYLSKQLPSGVKYILDENGNCVISSDGKEIKISGIKFNLTEKQKMDLRGSEKLDEILKYAYNSQQKLEIVPIEDGFIILNGEKFPIDRLNYNPLNNIEVMSGRFYLIPKKMEESFNIDFSDGKYHRNIIMHRVPDKSVNNMTFKSSDDEPLSANFMINPENNDVKMNMMFDLSKAKSIRDIVESIFVYNAFVDGKGYINSVIVNMKMDDSEQKGYDKKSAVFWEKLLLVENELNLSFEPPVENIDYDSVLEVEILYQSLINKKPFKDKNVISNVSGKWETNEKVNDAIREVSPLLLRFNAQDTFNLFGCEFTLHALIIVFNSKIKNIVDNENEKILYLEDLDENNKRYTSALYFKDEKTFNHFISQSEDMFIEMFKTAKKASEYLGD